MSGVTWNDVTKTSKDLALIKHKDKSDEELQSIIRHCSILSQSGDVATMAKALGEMQGCSEILAERRRKRAELSEAQEAASNARFIDWPNQLHARQLKAILNLPNAASYHGQLVAAILDEEGDLSSEAIHGWSEELSAMKDEDYATLLEGLVHEGIIAVNADKTYTLLRICTEDLFPEDPIRWAEKVMTRQGSRLYSKERELLQHLVDEPYPISNFEAFELDGGDIRRNAEENYSVIPAVTMSVHTLRNAGILAETRIPKSSMRLYYFPMLGEHKEDAV